MGFVVPRYNLRMKDRGHQDRTVDPFDQTVSLQIYIGAIDGAAIWGRVQHACKDNHLAYQVLVEFRVTNLNGQ